MSEQFNLDLRPREEELDYNAFSDAELRKIFAKELGMPIPLTRKDIIETLIDPKAYLARREEAQNEDRDDLRQTYRR